MMNVLVTGATTPVGGALVRGLLGDADVGCVLAVGVEQFAKGLPPVSERFRYLCLDLTRSRNMRRMLFGPARDLGITTVVHTALHRSALDSGESVHRLNVETTRELLHLSERHPTIERFLYRSFSEVYRIQHDRPNLIGEDHPLAIGRDISQRVRDRVEADLTVCARMGMSPLLISVLRFAEILAPNTGSQLCDYLSSRVCFRPMGFDPMVNVMSIEDSVRATMLALQSDAQGVFNIPGMDTLPLSVLIDTWGRHGVPVPGPLLAPLYKLRTRAMRREFRYDMNRRRFHFSGVLDGSRAREVLGYEPAVRVDWAEMGARRRGIDARA